MADPTQPWAERTVDLPPQAPLPQSYQRGVAQVQPRATAPGTPAAPHEPTATGWPQAEPDPRWAPQGYRRGQWRIGSGWTLFGGLVAFVCWGIWAISTRGNLVSPVLTFVLSLGVAAGLFALCRLVGKVILERQLGRVRRSARGAHLVTAIFLVGVGIAYLRQTEWVMDIVNWVRGLF
ncbi:hypothetical protein RB614_13760 [Phytohabitans sp. ZYX-F-186]|uniref:DUF1206 domain-containing protein n=1 Tax=Phytohabitans maris TaxID=3071409 RepID=A0ABU0ZGW5_9ACTN|nr:hypothetical protein [Phytohabitans sp. ZYX-F-186]MDQ7905582.1 hypothetical protein [Phytohabitans sp. ZYX-F-186]